MNSAHGYSEGAEVPEDKTDVIEMTESDIIEHCLKHTSQGLALNPIQVIEQIKAGEKWMFKGVLIKIIK